MEPSNFRSYDRSTDTEKYNFPSDLPLRPGTNSQGKAVEIRVNQFKVVQWPGKDVYQYDVSTTFAFISRGLELTSLQILIGNGAEKRGKIRSSTQTTFWAGPTTISNKIRRGSKIG